jgi:hypothetical protein
MPKAEIEQALFIKTPNGYVPNLVRFTGSDYKPKDRVRLHGKLYKVWELINDGIERTYPQLYMIARQYNINDDTTGRMVRKINETFYLGYRIVWGKNEEGYKTFRCVKL